MASIRTRKWQSKGKTKMAYVLDYTGLNEKGELKRHQKSFKKFGDAHARKKKIEQELLDGTHTPDSVSKTVYEAGKLWIERAETNGREKSTIDQYQTHLDRHIKPFIGNVKLSRLTAPQVDAYCNDLMNGAKGQPKRSRSMTRKVLVSLKAILSDAQRRGLVAQNVARAVKVDTKSEEREQQVAAPSKQEINDMLDNVPGRWRPLFQTAVFAGLRASEIRGLRWSDVDFDSKVISVHQRADKWNQIGPPKSKTSGRDIPMPPMLANTLKEWKLRCPRGKLGLAFPNNRGNVQSLPNIWNRFLKPLQVECGIVDDDGKAKYGMHAFRHFYASWLIDEGFMPKRVQTLMGHSSIMVTFDVYGHLFNDLEEDHKKLAAGEAKLIG